MRYRVGTRLKAFLGNGHGKIIGIKGQDYIAKWEDKADERLYTERQMNDIIQIAQYTVIEPDVLPEDLFKI